MSREALLCVVAGTLLVVGCRSSSKTSESPEQALPGPPSVVLITLDTTRRDRLGAYGSDRELTPHLDEVAKHGVVFTDARTEAPITLPSHVTMLTGLRLREHGIRENGTFHLRESATTLAEVLKAQGYRTGAFVSSFVLDSQFGVAQGFDTYDDEMTRRHVKQWRGLAVDAFERSGKDTTDRARAWLADAKGGDSPFFLWVHYYDPHWPHKAPKGFKKPHRKAYDAEVAFMDQQVGRLLQSAYDADPDLFLVVASDHGEMLGEHDRRGHGQAIYEPAMRVVLMMRHARLPAGRRPATRVRLTGIAPTVLAFLGVDAKMPGRNLLPLIEDDGALEPASPLYMETIVPERDERSAVRGVLVGNLKLHTWPKDNRVELFDIAKDPGELTDLSGERPDETRELQQLLDTLVPADKSAGDASEPTELDPETRKKLEALGYIE